MKKTLCACMAAVLALASLPVLGASAEETTYALGDVDMDGVVTGHDTAMVSRYVLDDTYTLTEEQLKLADVNEDGVVDQADADKLYHEMQVYQLGDADMDGRAAMMDAENIIIYSAKIAAGLETDWTPVQMNLADANLDGTVGIMMLAIFCMAMCGKLLVKMPSITRKMQASIIMLQLKL